MNSIIYNRIAFGVTGAAALGTSGLLFRDLADFGQWVIRADRDDVFWTFRNRHKIVAASVASSVINTGIAFRAPRCVPLSAWAVINGTSLVCIFTGYVNPELMMRPRNRDAVYVPAGKVLDVLKREETVIVTRVDDKSQPRAFPDSQILRPHVARVGTKPGGTPVTMTYCGLTNLGMAFETPPHEDGSDVELIPLIQLENNLVLMDKSTGHVGQQINGLDETALMEKVGGDSFHATKRRPLQEDLESYARDGFRVPKVVPTWRMTLGNFVRSFPEGDVFINDYTTFKDITKPAKSIYDSIIDLIFTEAIHKQAVSPEPIFPTLETRDKRLPPKEHVWAFNVGDDYAVVTEKFVRDGPGGVRNLTVGGEGLVASWDPDSSSLGIFHNPTCAPIKEPINVYGQRVMGGGGGNDWNVQEETTFDRVDNVRNGIFWCVWANFFPQTRINPES